jgi:hypothetical protein
MDFPGGPCVLLGGLRIDDDPSGNAAVSDGPCSMTHCTTCVMKDRIKECNKCQFGYGTPSATDKYSCLPCSTKSGCSNCESLSQCTECKSTATTPKTDGSGECAACGSNCRSCANAGPDKCDICAAGYALRSDGTCAACGADNCQICDSGYCTACKSGYSLNIASTPETCQPCGRSCKFCNKNPGKCDPDFCENGFVYHSETQTCEFPAAAIEDPGAPTWAQGSSTTKPSGSGDTGKLVGIIVGSTLGGFALLALIAWCCCCQQRPGYGAPPMGDYVQRGNYQMPSQQSSNYGAPTTFYQNSAFTGDYIKRFEPNVTYGGRC